MCMYTRTRFEMAHHSDYVEALPAQTITLTQEQLAALSLAKTQASKHSCTRSPDVPQAMAAEQAKICVEIASGTTIIDPTCYMYSLLAIDHSAKVTNRVAPVMASKDDVLVASKDDVLVASAVDAPKDAQASVVDLEDALASGITPKDAIMLKFLTTWIDQAHAYELLAEHAVEIQYIYGGIAMSKTPDDMIHLAALLQQQLDSFISEIKEAMDLKQMSPEAIRVGTDVVIALMDESIDAVCRDCVEIILEVFSSVDWRPASKLARKKKRLKIKQIYGEDEDVYQERVRPRIQHNDDLEDIKQMLGAAGRERHRQEALTRLARDSKDSDSEIAAKHRDRKAAKKAKKAAAKKAATEKV